MNTQPTALRLADAIDLAWLENVDRDVVDVEMIQSELRRLHALAIEYRDNGERLREISDGLKATVEEHQTTIAVLSDALSESRRVNADLVELLTLTLPYVEEGEEFNAPHKRDLSARIRAAITKAIGEQA